jgi:branched-subunit amino acid aminotransferase/4-amino-4-deoxychorismate lyase
MIDYNGQIFSDDDKILSAKDNGYFYGLGVYETLFVTRSQVAFYPEHIQRFKSCTGFFGIYLSDAFYSSLKDRMQKLIQIEDVKEGRLRLTFSTGTSTLLTPEPSRFTSTLSVQKIESKKESIDLYLSSYKKQYPSIFPSFVKYTANYPSLLSYQEANKNGFDEGLLLTQNNLIAEGSFCNFFWIDQQGHIKTPALSCSILDGVTRSKLLEAAKLIGLEICEGEYLSTELEVCTRAFISSSTRGLLPVKRVHHRTLDISLSEEIFQWTRKYEELLEKSLLG